MRLEPGKTGFLSRSLLTEQHTSPRVSHEKNLGRFSVQVKAEGGKKKKGEKGRQIYGQIHYEAAWEASGLVSVCLKEGLTLSGIKCELHEKKKQQKKREIGISWPSPDSSASCIRAFMPSRCQHET